MIKKYLLIIVLLHLVNTNCFSQGGSNLPEYVQPTDLPVFNGIKPYDDITKMPDITLPTKPIDDGSNGKGFMDWVNEGKENNGSESNSNSDVSNSNSGINNSSVSNGGVSNNGGNDVKYAPKKFNADATNFDRFRNSPCYNSLGFNPDEPLEEREKRYRECEEGLSERQNENTFQIVFGILLVGGCCGGIIYLINKQLSTTKASKYSITKEKHNEVIFLNKINNKDEDYTIEAKED